MTTTEFQPVFIGITPARCEWWARRPGTEVTMRQRFEQLWAQHRAQQPKSKTGRSANARCDTRVPKSWTNTCPGVRDPFDSGFLQDAEALRIYDSNVDCRFGFEAGGTVRCEGGAS